jgi:lipopolysaccharide transport system ATP-binding protein
MSDTVIQVENLSKHYVLGKNGNSEGLRHVIHDALTAPLRRWQNRPASYSEPNIGKNGSLPLNQKPATDFWALKDVSFEIKQGEVVGVIGRNGAGKSTLLKILSRITEQTEGRVEITGRVASLLEVGTGFHPELTGRENVFLNGAILGMTRSEIRKKFDEIVAFAEVEKFLDTPVKRYSSGMYVRLAFAVAAHLEPEILIVDEVLAVGDAQFQKKCLGKMKDIAKGGRTVLFVSHNLSTVKTLCQTGVLLDRGCMIVKDSASEVLNRYVSTSTQSTGRWVRPQYDRQLREISFETVYLTNEAGRETADFDLASQIHLHIEAISNGRHENIQFAIRVTNHEGVAVLTTANTDEAKSYLPISPGAHRYKVTLPAAFLMPGRYTLKVNAHAPKSHSFHLIDDEIAFVIHDTEGHESVLRDDRAGVVNLVLPWRTY